MATYLSKPQSKVFVSPRKYVACAAGLGSGKTFAIALRLLNTYFSFKGCNLAYSAPTYGLIRDIIYPLLEDMLISSGVQYSLNKTESQLTVPGYGTIFFRSMTKPETIVGFSILDCFLDELDVIPEKQAELVVDKFLARMRQKINNKLNQMYLISSPEGYKYMYKNFEKNPLQNSELIRMSTYSNQRNLPDDYIQSMISKYPKSMIEAYLYGMFVNIMASEVWKDFNRKLNHTSEIAYPGERLHIGMDFNVNKGCSVIHVVRENPVTNVEEIFAVGEITKMFDTPEAIATIKNEYAGHPITVYPDSSGKSKKSVDATKSDIALLKNAGFLVKNKSKNPNIKDRVTATNAMFCNGLGQRRYFINTDRCPIYTEALEHQPYDDDGLPLKDGEMDNITDAGTYPIAYLYPVKSSRSYQTELEGM